MNNVTAVAAVSTAATARLGMTLPFTKAPFHRLCGNYGNYGRAV